MKRDEPVFLNPLPPYEPIEWTPENERLFLNGFIKVETMTREEFRNRYPDTLPSPQ